MKRNIAHLTLGLLIAAWLGGIYYFSDASLVIALILCLVTAPMFKLFAAPFLVAAAMLDVELESRKSKNTVAKL